MDDAPASRAKADLARDPVGSRRSEWLSIAAGTVLAALLLGFVNGWAPGRAEGDSAVTSAASSARPASPSCAVLARADLPPRSGALFGVSIDWDHDSLAAYSARLGRAPAVAVTFADLPMDRTARAHVDAAVDQARAVGATLLLTLEPTQGLGRVTTTVADRLARDLDRYNRTGVPVVVRFAHEMNGSWYRWGQDPAAYRAAFRRVASAVHTHAPGTATLWAPNYGGGYPFSGGRYESRAGSEAARQLDTDHDGTVTEADDPYAPYWPGRRYVDWVGMSLYHWGDRYPWGENEVPEPHKFVDLLRGTYDGKGGDETAVPDFYGRYGKAMGIPVAVTETAAFFRRGAGGGAGELAVKQAWWRQVFAASTAAELPQLKMVNWFEWDKEEPEVGSRVRWTVTRSPETLPLFREALPRWAQFAAGRPTC